MEEGVLPCGTICRLLSMNLLMFFHQNFINALKLMEHLLNSPPSLPSAQVNKSH